MIWIVPIFLAQRDEEVGVYGFIFFKNGSWITVIIDEYAFLFSSLLYSSLINLLQLIIHVNPQI